MQVSAIKFQNSYNSLKFNGNKQNIELLNSARKEILEVAENGKRYLCNKSTELTSVQKERKLFNALIKIDNVLEKLLKE